MKENKLKQAAFSFSTNAEMSSNDFMISDCNREAFSLIETWPDWPANGIIIYGPKGCGKTHLTHLFAEKVILSQEKTFKVPTFNCQQINLKNIERICKSTDVIVLENLSKNINQEALFHLFNNFDKGGKYMLWTSEIAPARLNFSLKDLQSRLNTLPAIAITEPDDTMLRALIIKLFDDRQLMISPEILEYIVNNTERSFAYIENLVKEIDEISLAYKSAINYKVVREALNNLNDTLKREPDLFTDF